MAGSAQSHTDSAAGRDPTQTQPKVTMRRPAEHSGLSCAFSILLPVLNTDGRGMLGTGIMIVLDGGPKDSSDSRPQRKWSP